MLKYSLSKVLFPLILVFEILPVKAQLNCDNLDFDVPVITDCDARLPTEVALFNVMANHFALIDTIQYHCTGHTIEYTYQGAPLKDWKYNPKDCGKRFMLSGFKTSINFKLIASMPTGNNKSIVYEMIRPEKDRRRVIFKSYHEEGILPVGKYVQKNCSGLITAEGTYALEKKPSSYTYNRYDADKRMTVSETSESDKTSVRKGIWKFYDDNGNLIHTQKYPSAKMNHAVYENDLCEEYGKVYQYNYYTNSKISPGIEIFNDVHRMLGRNEYLSYDITHRGLIYYLNGEVIQGIFFNHDGPYKPWEYQLENHPGELLFESKDNSINIYRSASDSEGEMIRFANHTVDIYKMKNRHPNGMFERWSCEGQRIIQGQYTTIDTLYITREESFNPETYEAVITETEHHKASIKSGTWNYYNTEGQHIAVESYPGKTSGDVYAGYLCDVVTPESRDIRKTRPHNYLLFNSMCHQFNLPYWVSNDLVLGNDQHYFNGKPIEAPAIAYLKNNAMEVTLTTPVGEIKIHTKSNDYAAGGTMGRPKRIYLNASITFPNQQGIRLLFSDNELSYFQTNQGVNSGEYEKKQCNGLYLEKGQYCLIDSFSRDTMVVFDPETYEERIVVTESEFQSAKTGVWKKYDLNGILEQEETFGSCQ